MCVECVWGGCIWPRCHSSLDSRGRWCLVCEGWGVGVECSALKTRPDRIPDRTPGDPPRSHARSYLRSDPRSRSMTAWLAGGMIEEKEAARMVDLMQRRMQVCG